MPLNYNYSLSDLMDHYREKYWEAIATYEAVASTFPAVEVLEELEADVARYHTLLHLVNSLAYRMRKD